jgi:hypothetical protein
MSPFVFCALKQRDFSCAAFYRADGGGGGGDPGGGGGGT